MEEVDKWCLMIRMGVSGWMFFLVPAYLGSSGQQQQQRPFNGLWSGTTHSPHSPTHTHPDQRASFITFLHLQWSMASCLFNLRAWQSSRTTSFFGLPLGLEPTTSYSIHFFTQSSSSFRNTWPYQRSLICCSTSAMSSTPSLSLSSLLGTKGR